MPDRHLAREARCRRAVQALVAVCLVVVPAAAAHGGGGARLGYSSTITAVTPAGGDVSVIVLDADDRLRLTLRGSHTLVIDGYDGEPYLRFDADGVFRNRRSPATYLNDDRYGGVKLPQVADAEVDAEWERLEQKPAYDWHDHRIHWMSTTYPPKVAADLSVPHHVFDWAVPGSLDGKPFRITGSLDYAPRPDGGTPVWLVVLGAVGGLAAVGLVVLRQRQMRRGREAS